MDDMGERGVFGRVGACRRSGGVRRLEVGRKALRGAGARHAPLAGFPV